MTEIEEMKFLYDRIKSRYYGLSIRYLPHEEVEERKVKMLEVLKQNLKMLEDRKKEFFEIKETFLEEMKKKESETLKFLEKLDEDIKKVETATIQARSVILIAEKQRDNLEEMETLPFARNALKAFMVDEKKRENSIMV